MRYKLHLLLLLLITLPVAALSVSAQETVSTDTVFNPRIVFSAMPDKYEIAGISVSGADNYQDHTVIGYTGLKVGEVIEIPGSEINAAAKRLWRQGLFASVQIKVEKWWARKCGSCSICASSPASRPSTTMA